tara:strand:- start:1002 stop:1433 length:432 start_codon:yes stop_codon:yes gene_type:complete
MSRSGVLTTIDTLLTGVTPAFSTVYRYELLSVPTTPCAAFWLSEHRELFETFTDASTNAVFNIKCYWRPQMSPDTGEDLDAEIWDVVVAIKTALRGDSQLSGNCTDSKPGDATVTLELINGQPYRTATIPFDVWIYGEETIAP